MKELQKYYSKEQLCAVEKGNGLPFFRLEKLSNVAPHLGAEYHYSHTRPTTADVSPARYDLILEITRPWLKVLCACNQWVLDGGTGPMVLNYAARVKIEAKQHQTSLDDQKALNGSTSARKKSQLNL